MPKKGNFSEYQTKGFDQSTDHGVQGGVPSDSFNHKDIGKPITGRHSDSIAMNKKKYGIFEGHEVGEHFGRSGSPTGGNSEKGE